MKKILPIVSLSGLLMIVAAGISYAIKGSLETYMAILLWIGLLSLLFTFYVGFTDIKGIFTGRSAKYGANTVAMIIVFITIIVLISFMSTRYKVRWDLTATKRYTLSAQTKKIIQSLKKDVEAIAFYRSDERTRQEMEDLLQELSHLSGKLTYRFIDPDKQPGAASKYGVTSYRTTLIISGKNQQTVGLESEEKLINAIMKVTRDEIKSIYFLKGHGEIDLSDIQSSGYKGLKEAIEKESYMVKELTLLSTEEVPDDCSLLIIGGPKSDLIEDEITKLNKYIERGGSIMAMIDPGTFPVADKFAKKYGFNLGNDIIIDKMSQVFGANYLVPVVSVYEEKHPITEEFNIMTFFPLARSVTIKREPEMGSYPLAMTGEASWGEIDVVALEEGQAEYNEDKEIKGPLSIAAVTTINVSNNNEEGNADRSTYAKMVMIGDSDFVNNTHINLAGNKDLFLNIVGWLAEEADLIAVRKKSSSVSPVILTSTQGRFIFWIPVVVAPSLVLVIGIAVLTRRKIGS